MTHPLRCVLLLSLAARVAAWGWCGDSDESCANWAKSGECDKSEVVKKKCPHSCSLCNHRCRDTNDQCPQWADGGQCDTNLEFMYKECPVSCGVCGNNPMLPPTTPSPSSPSPSPVAGECPLPASVAECRLARGEWAWTCDDPDLLRHPDCSGADL